MYGLVADAEVGSAAFVDPEAALIDAPCIALDALGAADLTREANVAAVADVAPVSAAVVGGTGNDLHGWRTWGWSVSTTTAADGKVGSAATVDPEAAIVDAPGVAADTGRAADLTN
jgi:uncharacterized protein GlcG (DUF336 family)